MRERERGGIHRLFFYASHPPPPCGQQCVELAASDIRQCHLPELHQPVGNALHDQWPLWRHGTVYVVLLLLLCLARATAVIIQVLRSTLTLLRDIVYLCVFLCAHVCRAVTNYFHSCFIEQYGGQYVYQESSSSFFGLFGHGSSTQYVAAALRPLAALTVFLRTHPRAPSKSQQLWL